MADAKKIVGGLGKVTKALLADGEEAVTAAQRAEAGRKGAALIKTQPQVKASEALGQQMEKGVKRVTTTQADRTRVGGGNIGGAPFSAISEADPNYAGKVWGVMDEGTASRLTNLTDPETVWTTMLGSANQLKTNPVVFDKLKRQFIDSMKQGNLSPELEAKINHNLALTFGEGAQIRDPKIWRQADTFEKRAALADLMMGQGIPPSKGGVALGGEKSGKGVIFRPTDTLKRETEPSLLHTEHGGDVPTFAAGPRLFKLEKESVYRPDLHPGFPTLLTGKDMNVNMIPTPTEIFLPDWHKAFKEKKPERFQRPWSPEIVQRRKSGSYEVKGGEGPGYYDLALGLEGEGLPSQALHDEYIRHLIREGFKDGGGVDIDAADRRLSAAIQKRMAKGGEVDIEAADARLADAIAKRTGMAEGGEAGFKKIQFMNKGGKLAKGIANVGKRLLADAPAESKIIQAPTIMLPSKLSTVREGVRGMKGNYGAKRVERAADEIPNLEKMFQEDALGEAFTGDNARGLMTINPADFEKYAQELSKRTSVGPKAAELAKQGDIDKHTVPTDEYIKYLQQLSDGFSDVPYLNLYKDEVGLPTQPKILGHEGRHRNRSLADKGETAALVQVNPRGDLREGMPRRTQEEFIEALKEELERSNRLVIPESEPYFLRPSIKLPDVYATGGKIVKGGLNIAKRLMADNSLPAIEREANLAKFLEPSKIPQRLYHGTTATEGGKGQEAIRRIKPSKEGALGSGVYTTPNTPHASSYTGIPNDEALAMMSQGNDYTKKMADQFMADRASGRLREGQAGGNMLPVHVQMRNPLIIGKSGRNIDPAADALMSLGMDEASAIKLVERAFEEKGNIGKQIQSRAQAQGYDGIMQYRGDELSEVVSYNPNAVKSAIGNRGTYDINEADLSKAHGGLAMAKGGKLAALGNIGKRLLADPTAPRSVSEGDIVNGMLVRKDIPNTSSIGASLSNYSTHGLQEVPMSAFQTVGKPKYYSAQEEKRTKELARQIQENKELNPLIVVKDAEGHYILEGGHRFDALRELGIDSFPALMVHDLESLGTLAKADGGKIVKGLGKIAKKLMADEVPVTEAAKGKTQALLKSNLGPAFGAYGYTDDILRRERGSFAGNFGLDYGQKLAPSFEFVPIKNLKVTEKVVDAKVRSLMDAIKESGNTLDNKIPPVIVNSNGNVLDGHHRIEAARRLGYEQVPVIEKFDIQNGPQLGDEYADGGSVFKKLTFMADGGGAFKKLQFMDKGGITTSAGSFSPEELGVNASDIGMSDKRWDTIKRNAADLYGQGKEQLEKEYRQLGRKGGKKDFAIRVGSQFLGGVPDLINLGLEGIDLAQSFIPAISKPESVLDTAGTGDRIPKFKLASEKPFLGSQQFIDKFKEAELLGDKEFPLTELMAGFAAPAAAVGALRKSKQAYKGAKSLIDTPKKRRGGLTAMAR